MNNQGNHRLTVTFLGTGDAFGSGGRLQPSIHVSSRNSSFLIDCGASALLSMKRLSIHPDGIHTIFISHLHGDHFSGIPFILRETQIISQRSAPLTIVGPPGLEESVRIIMGTMFPGSWDLDFSFKLEFIEVEPLRPYSADGITAIFFPAVHSPAVNPHSIRLECGSRVIAYSGDTEWNPQLIEAARGSDLFICECFEYNRSVKRHMDYKTLLDKRHLLQARRIMLTHMNDSVLAHAGSLSFECAEDGMSLII
jgi:ribonuclease BN (tRNA processing enzyme)